MLACLALAAAAALASAALPVPAAAAAQQAGTVSGRVLEAGTEEPVPGAQVTVEGTTVGAIADDDGRYVLSGLPAGPAVLRVEMAGYAPAEKRVPVLADRPTRADFALETQVFRLDEIVVTGTAGSARQREVAHSVDQILLEDVDEPVVGVENLLAARVPGLTVLQSSAMAGSGSQIRLRGNVSLALSNQPLVYLDGIRVRSEGYPRNVPAAGDARRGPNDVPSPLNDLNVEDIERVEVVKGPAATTLYGAEAASGVIQIFTKRGHRGGPVWTARVDQGVDEMQPYGTDADPFVGLDPWLRSAWRQRYSLSAGGGADVRYYASAAFDDNEGVLPNDHQRRFSARLNADAAPLPGLDLAWSSSLTLHDLRATPAGNNAHGLTLNAFRGDENQLGDGSKESVDRILEYDIRTGVDRFITGITATWAPSERLSNRVTVGYDLASLDLWQLRPFGFVLAPGGILADEDWTGSILTLDYVGSLVLPLRTDLRTTVSWGAQNVVSEEERKAGYAESFPGPGEPTLDSGALRLDFESRTRVANGGVFGQALLDWRNRWFLTAGLRLDGSSAFGEELGLEPYPRAGLSYVVSEEPFWPEGWGRLKLRTAYGHAGRIPGAFDAERTWLDAGLDGRPAFLPNKIGNPDLGPERTEEIEIGFEGAFAGDRMSVDFTWYGRETTDALFPVTQVPSEGFLGTQLENVGTLRNRGLELAVDGTLLRAPDWEWDLGLSVATNHSEVLDLQGSPPLNVYEEHGWLEEGQPAPVIRGVWVRNADELAEPDVVRDHAFGPNLPTHTLGFRTALRLPGRVRLSARGEYLGGHYIADRTARNLADNGILPNCREAYELWDAQRDRLTAWERFFCEPGTAHDDAPIYPADFFRLRDVTLEVPVPGRLLRSPAATLTFSARNWLTWKNDGVRLFDPEMAGHGGVHSPLRTIEFQVPAPATFTVSLRAVY
jgi:TonB-dependent SusC/RagA subfamily outer membrane receptor